MTDVPSYLQTGLGGGAFCSHTKCHSDLLRDQGPDDRSWEGCQMAPSPQAQPWDHSK